MEARRLRTERAVLGARAGLRVDQALELDLGPAVREPHPVGQRHEVGELVEGELRAIKCLGVAAPQPNPPPRGPGEEKATQPSRLPRVPGLGARGKNLEHGGGGGRGGRRGGGHPGGPARGAAPSEVPPLTLVFFCPLFFGGEPFPSERCSGGSSSGRRRRSARPRHSPAGSEADRPGPTWWASRPRREHCRRRVRGCGGAPPDDWARTRRTRGSPRPARSPRSVRTPRTRAGTTSCRRSRYPSQTRRASTLWSRLTASSTASTNATSSTPRRIGGPQQVPAFHARNTRRDRPPGIRGGRRRGPIRPDGPRPHRLPKPPWRTTTNGTGLPVGSDFDAYTRYERGSPPLRMVYDVAPLTAGPGIAPVCTTHLGPLREGSPPADRFGRLPLCGPQPGGWAPSSPSMHLRPGNVRGPPPNSRHRTPTTAPGVVLVGCPRWWRAIDRRGPRPA